MKPEDEIRFQKKTIDEQDKKLRDLVYRFLPAMLKYDGLSYVEGSWHMTEDGRLFPWLKFEDKNIKDYLERQKSAKTGHVCPKCFSWNVEMLKEVVKNSGRDFTIWTQDWKCGDCGDTWQYLRVWGD